MLATPISANYTQSKANTISFGRHHGKTYSEEDRRAMDDLVARTSDSSASHSTFNLDHIQRFIEHMTIKDWVIAGLGAFALYHIGKFVINKIRHRGQ